MREWKWLDWTGYGSILLGAFFLALKEGLDKLPEQFVPNIFTAPIWAFLPLILLLIGTVILFFRAMGWIGNSKATNGGKPPANGGTREARDPPSSNPLNPMEASLVIPQTAERMTSDLRGYGPVGTSKSPSDLISQIDLSTVSHIYVIAITGEVTVKQLCDDIERAKDHRQLPEDLSLHILLRSDSSADSTRVLKKNEVKVALRRLHHMFNWLQFEIRHYSSVSPLRCMILEHRDHSFSAHLSFYDWKMETGLSVRESANPIALIRRNVPQDDVLLSVYLSWFRHFWGKHKIQTLIFDFDDTLFQTTSAQVKGWVKAIRSCLQSGLIVIDALNDEVASAAANEETLTERMETIFLDAQQEDKIFSRIFRLMPSDEILNTIRSARLRIREEETEKYATPIPDIAGQVRELRSEYQLVIISATSEKTINNVLKTNNLEIFPFVFGKEASHKWTSIEGKSPTFIRISNMIGVPLDRMIFVGDSDADYRAAKQLGLTFIESRFNASRHNRETLVKSRDPNDDAYVVGGKDMVDLKAVIARIEGATPD